MKDVGAMGKSVHDDKARRAFGQLTMRDIALNRRGDILREASDGTKQVVFALDHELLSSVISRAKRAGGLVNVIVALQDGRTVVSHLDPVSHEKAVAHPDHFGPDDIHSDISIGMFVSSLMSTNKTSFSVSIRLPNQGAEVTSVQELVKL